MAVETAWERLQRNLEGVYDLDKAEDCRKVIEVLLRDLEEANARASDARSGLKSLALMVTSGNQDMRDAARKVLLDGSGRRVDMLGYVMRMVGQMDDVRTLPDDVLVSEVLDKVWVSYDMSGRESALVAEVLDRFKGKRP